MIKKILGSDDDDDDLDRSSSLVQTQRFTKSGTIGSKDLKTTQGKSKQHEVSNLKIDLNRINDDDDDSLNDSDDDTNSRTARSTSSATASQLTPKPKERSFLRTNTEKPKIQPRRIDIDDDDRNVFGQTTMKSSPRHQILSLREEEERDKSFMKGFHTEKKRQSPTDLFDKDHKYDERRNSRKSPHHFEDKTHIDSDDERFTTKQQSTFQKSRQLPNDSFSIDHKTDGRRNSRKSPHDDSDDDKFTTKTIKQQQQQQSTFQKPRHSLTDSDKSQSRKNSNRSKEDSDQSDHDEDDHFNKQSNRSDYGTQRQSHHDLTQTSPKYTDTNGIQHQSSSSRPGSASKKEIESNRRSSYCEDQDTIIPPITNQKSQSRPTSAKSNTSRQHTQSFIDNVASANNPPTYDPLTSNNEALAETLQSSSSPSVPPRPLARRPPKPKSSSHTTTGGIHKKNKFPVSSRYKEITSRVDSGRKPLAEMDLSASVDRALEKEFKTQTLPRPQSSRERRRSANNSNNERQRRRSSSGYEHVKPRVNTNLSINFDELNTTQMRADSSQSIKDAVYLEWVKAKEEQKKIEKKEMKRWQEETTKRIDKSQIEKKVHLNMQNLERWRQEKDEQIRKKRQEENELKRELMETKKREQQQKKKDSKDGFDDWKAKKDEELKQKYEEEHEKKTEIEKRQEEKQKKILEAEKAYNKWNTKKTEQIKKTHQTNKTTQNDQFKKIREQEETKFVSAQEAYEKWIKDKEKYDLEQQINTQRRNSLSNQQQQQVPFLPGGGQRNTGKVRHVVW